MEVGLTTKEAVAEMLKPAGYLSPLRFRLSSIFTPFNFVPFIFATLFWKISLPLIFGHPKKICSNLLQIDQQVSVGSYQVI